MKQLGKAPTWVLVGTGLAALLMLLLWWQPIERIDTVQRRNTTVFHFKDNDNQLRQSFTATHHGFSKIKVWIAVFEPDKLTNTTTVFNASLLDQNGAVLATTQQAVTALAHNTILEFGFPAQHFSKDKSYQFAITASNTADVVALWGSDYDSYHAGTAIAANPGDIRFETRYRLTATEAVSGVFQWLPRWLQVSAATLIGLILPGLLVLQLHPQYASLDRISKLAFGFGSGISVTALLWLGMTQLNLRWTSLNTWLLMLTLSGIFLWQRRQSLKRVFARPASDSATITLLVLTGLLFLTRILNVQHLVLPALVDVPNHALLTRILLEAGNIAPTLGPQLFETPLYYHIGLHAIVGTLQLMLPHLALTDIFLVFTQLLVIGAALAAYAFTANITKTRWIGIIALIFVGFISRFPNQFTDWGRITQLAGQITLLVLMWIGIALPQTKSIEKRWQLALIIGCLAAGLSIVHIRVIAFFIVFAVACALFNWRRLPLWTIAGAITLGLSSPWMWRVYSNVVRQAESAQKALSSGTTSYTKFPVDYVTSFVEPYWLPLAILGLILAIWHRQRWGFVITAWLVLQFVILNLDQFGLRTTWVITNHTFYITLFVPACIAVGYAVWHLINTKLGLILWMLVEIIWAGITWLALAPDWLIDSQIVFVRFAFLLYIAFAQPLYTALTKREATLFPALQHTFARLALGILIGTVTIFGLRHSLDVIEPGAVLGTEADMAALDWINANTTLDDHFLINLWPWYDGTVWAGADAGYWIPAVTGRTTTTPTFWYTYNKPYAQRVFDFGTIAWETTDVNTPEFLSALATEGVTHVYIGPQGQHFTPDKFLNSAHYSLVFSNGLAWVFAVN